MSRETMMKVFRRFLGPVLVVAPVAAWAASSFIDAAARLDGTWEGDGYVLQVDSQRAQASVDPNRPFQWQRFLVRAVTEDKVKFAIGSELFEAKIGDDGLTLTSTSFRGEHILHRASPPAAQ
jgi:hypothetical protein